MRRNTQAVLSPRAACLVREKGPLQDHLTQDTSGKRELGSRENTPPWGVAFGSCKSNQKRTRNEVGSSPRPTLTCTRISFQLTESPGSVSLRPDPGNFPTCLRRTPPFGQPWLDLETTSLSGMLWSRQEGRRMAARFDPCASRYTPLLGPPIVHRCRTQSPKGRPLSPASPSWGSGAALPPLTPGHSLSPSRDPSINSAPFPGPELQGASRWAPPYLHRVLSGRSVSSPSGCLGRRLLLWPRPDRSSSGQGVGSRWLTEAAGSCLQRSSCWGRAGPGAGCRGSLPCGLAGDYSWAPVCPPGEKHEMQARGCVRARVCVSVWVRVWRRRPRARPARAAAANRLRGRGRLRAPGGREPGLQARRRTSPPRRHLTQRPLRLPRCVLPALPAGDGRDSGKPASEQNKTNPPAPSRTPPTYATERMGITCPPPPLPPRLCPSRDNNRNGPTLHPLNIFRTSGTELEAVNDPKNTLP